MRFIGFKPTSLIVQDMSDYLTLIDEQIDASIAVYEQIGFLRNDFHEWIIREILEEVYLLNVVNHDHRRDPFRTVYDIASRGVGSSFLKLSKEYIEAPILFGDTKIQIQLRDKQLYLWYIKNGKEHAGKERITIGL